MEKQIGSKGFYHSFWIETVIEETDATQKILGLKNFFFPNRLLWTEGVMRCSETTEMGLHVL